MNLLRSILNSVWMIDVTTARAAGPFIAKLAKGENTDWMFAMHQDSRRQVGAWYPKANAFYGDFEKAPFDSLAVFRISGPLTKWDQNCGPMGMMSLMRDMQRADRMQNITAHLLEIDSGGGEATIVDTVAMAIRGLEKPVVAIVNGMAASAAYYLAAAADEIYASERTDMLGSIGVVMSFADVRPYYEKEGIVFHEIYAEESTLKNDDFRQALEGNYKPLQDKILNPYAEAFISRMKEFRGAKLKDDGEVFKGQTYLAPAARKIGLIDGIKTWQQAAERALLLAKKKKTLGSRDAAAGRNIQQSQNNMVVNFSNINAVTGYNLEVDEDGGIYLNNGELAKLEQALGLSAPPQAAQEDTISIQSELEEVGSALTSMTARLETLTEKIELQAQRLAKLEDRTSGDAGPSMAKAGADPAEEETNADPRLKAAEEEFQRALRAARR